MTEEQKKANYPFIDYSRKMTTGPNQSAYINEGAFMDYIKQYEGSDYYNQYLNAFNAYNSQEFTPNFWQKLGYDLFGDSNPWNNFENQRLATFYDTISRIQEAQHAEQYNSESAQAERQRQAGLNPDLTGGISAGEAGNIDQKEMATPALNDGSSIMPEVGAGVMQAFELCMKMAQGIQGLESGDIGLMLGGIDLKNKTDDSIIKNLGNLLSEDDLKVLLDLGAKDDKGNPLWTDEQKKKAEDNLYVAMESFSNDLRLPKRLRKKIKKSWLTLPLSGSINVNKEFYGLIKDAYENKKGAVEGAGHPFTKGGFMKCIEIFGEHVQETIIDIQKLQAKLFENDAKLQDKRLKVEGKQLDYEINRLSVTQDGKSLGTLAGESDANAFTAESYQKEFEAKINEMWTGIMRDLRKQDTWWSSMLQFAIPIVRLWLQNLKMPTVSHTTSN